MLAYAAKEPDGIGVGKPAHPFAVTVEAKVPVRHSPHVSISNLAPRVASPPGVLSLVIDKIDDTAECDRTRWIRYQVPRLPHHHRGRLVSSASLTFCFTFAWPDDSAYQQGRSYLEARSYQCRQ